MSFRASQLDLEPMLVGLNNAQRLAVTNPSSVVQILAPPGSGKTRTLTSRVAWLLCPPHSLDPRNVIVATFTVKASREMRERISKLVGNGVESRLVLGTFHSIARRYLIKYGHLIDIKAGWGIADSGDSLGIRIIKRRKSPLDPSQVRSRISHFKARNSSPAANALPPPSTATIQSTQARVKDISAEDFVQIFQDYEEALEASNLLDYDDLLLRCLELLKHNPECVSNVEAVLIDEFQDTNLVQFELMKLLAWKRERITIVGDPDQSIYGFRAAEIRNLSRMVRAYPQALVVHLEQNYRSSASILLAALEVIEQDHNRPKKPLTPTHAVGTRPVLRRIPSAFLEASWIVSEIQRVRAMTGGMVELGDIAILVRSANLTRNIETSFVKAGVAYKMVGGLRFYDRVEIKTLLDYLRVVQNLGNNDALARIVNTPARKVGDATVKTLLDEGDKRTKSMWEIIRAGLGGIWGDVKIAKAAEKGLSDFVGIILSTQKQLEEDDQGKGLVDVVEFLMRKIGYEDYLRRGYPEDFDARWSNVSELLSQAQEVERLDDDEDMLPDIDGLPQSQVGQGRLQLVLDRFLSNTALANEVKGDDGVVGRDQVTISTIHASKGLEWPIVFIPAVYQGSIPHSRADDTDEERRLLYVAMTRAQALLYMSCPVRNSQKDKTKLSQFLAHRSLHPLLHSRGPALGFSSVQSVGRILGRECPSEVQIQTAVDKSGIASTLDDQFPDKDPSESDSEGDGLDEDGVRLKRRRLQSEQASSRANRPLDEGFRPVISRERPVGRMEKPPPGVVVGFKSAGSHMQELKETRLNQEAERARVEREKQRRGPVMAQPPNKGSGLIKGAPAAPARSNKRLADQGSLLSYFGQKAPGPVRKVVPPKTPTATEVMRDKSIRDKNLKEQIEALPQPKFPVRPDHHSGVMLLSSSPTRVPPKRRRKREIPSSPPPPVSSVPFSRHIESARVERHSAVEETTTTVESTVVIHSAASSRNTTTVTNSNAVVMAAAAVAAPKRRTLGVRRSMGDGWRNRASAKR
ncbi:P-loop containing nucleoside triphosphate hydrolase protein [Tuber magnatum]|uniref:DNA 3'-5' helicase n=1 Tax=Tuber magnatum TaxID=42249 RepID=A0A317SVV5_9PEZI|nr:P-loop containing nucleoside triphosphate hydrolase protein [Tuber magnatum]